MNLFHSAVSLEWPGFRLNRALSSIRWFALPLQPALIRK